MAALIGVPLGMLAGYGSRRADGVLSWANDALMSVPALTLALTIVAVLGPGSLTNAMIAVGIVTAPRFFRVAAGGDAGRPPRDLHRGIPRHRLHAFAHPLPARVPERRHAVGRSR